MHDTPTSEQPSWASRPLSIQDLLEAARTNILGNSDSVPISSLSKSEVGFVNTILERHYHVSMEREFTGYSHIRTCRQLPPVGPVAEAARHKAQEAMDQGAALAVALEIARLHVKEKLGIDLQPLLLQVPLNVDEAAIEAADHERAAAARSAGIERGPGGEQPWTVHHLAIDPQTGLPVVKVADKLQAVYDDLPNYAWNRRPVHA
ncbi:MAG: hypothetical protein ACYDBQ_01200 [Thermoplasmatota archaeon]